MMNKKQLGLFKVKAKRVTVRSKPGSFFIGTLFEDDYFYIEHVHKTDHQWVWGYGGKHYKNFGWVRLGGRFDPENNQKAIADKYGQKIADSLKRGEHRNKRVEQFASTLEPGLPPPFSRSATGSVYFLPNTFFTIYLNYSDGVGKNVNKLENLPFHVDKVSWRYMTKDTKMHCVVWHPPGLSMKRQPGQEHSDAFGHGKWGFIKNDANIDYIKIKRPYPFVWKFPNIIYPG
jgi:hypothetical protein